MANKNLLWIHSVQTEWISEDKSRWAERWANKNFHNFRSLFQIECVSMEMEYTLRVMLISRIPMQRLMIKAYTQCFCVEYDSAVDTFPDPEIFVIFNKDQILPEWIIEYTVAWSLLIDRLLKWLMIVSIENMWLFVYSQIITSLCSATWFYNVCLIRYYKFENSNKTNNRNFFLTNIFPFYMYQAKNKCSLVKLYYYGSTWFIHIFFSVWFKIWYKMNLLLINYGQTKICRKMYF